MMQQSPRSLALAVSSVTKSRPRTHVRCRPSTQTQTPARGFANSHIIYAALAAPGGMRMPKDAMSKMPKQQGMKSRLKTLPKSETPSDFGLLPKTYIRPVREAIPKLFSKDYGKRLSIEWLQLRSLAEAFLALLYMAKFAGVGTNQMTGKKIKMPLMMNDRAIIARELHKDYYTALAKGDLPKIREIAATGLVEFSDKQIQRQKLLEKPEQSFKIIRYLGVTYPRWLPWPIMALMPNKSTKVVLDRLVPLPMGYDSWIRQIVVRLRSIQSLKREGEKGGLTSSLTEWVVIQKVQTNGKEQPWKIWGTTVPLTKEQIDDLVSSSNDGAGFFSGLKSIFRARLTEASGGKL